MKILELIWACLLVVLSLAISIWMVSTNPPVFPMCFMFLTCFLSIYLLCVVLKERYNG